MLGRGLCIYLALKRLKFDDINGRLKPGLSTYVLDRLSLISVPSSAVSLGMICCIRLLSSRSCRPAPPLCLYSSRTSSNFSFSLSACPLKASLLRCFVWLVVGAGEVGSSSGNGTRRTGIGSSRFTNEENAGSSIVAIDLAHHFSGIKFHQTLC